MPPRSLLGWPEESSGAAPKNKNSLPMSQQLQESREERIMFPQHLQSLIQSTTKVTIVTDNPKTPPLSDQSPVLRTERGLPPLFSPTSAATTMQYNKKPESRWDSMPQTTKRIIIDDNPINSSLARIRLNGQLRGGGAPAAAATTNGVTSTVTATTTAAGDQGGGACLSPVRWLDYSPSSGSASASASASAIAGSPLHNTKYTQSPDKSPGLNFPRRRESIEQQEFVVGKNTGGVSLLSQVLSAFDLSDDDEAAGGVGDDDERAGAVAAGKWTKNIPHEENPSLKQVPGVTQSTPPFAKQQYQPQNRSPQPTATQRSTETLSKPVRRESIDSAVLAGAEVEDFFSDEDEDDHDEEISRADDSFDDDDDDFEMEQFGCTNTCNDDSTLVTAKTTSTSSTLSTLKSFNSQINQDE